jgi:hypothetical protein
MTEIRSAADWAGFFRERIAALGLTHLQVDQQADLADGYVNKIVNGKKLPGAVTIERLCRVLKISLRPVADEENENCALEDCDNAEQRGDTANTQRSDLHVETGTGCGPAGAGVAGEAAGARRSGPAAAGGSDPQNSLRRDPGAAGRRMNDVMERPRAIAHSPPPARAPAVVAQQPVLERELADLKQRIAEATLAAYEGRPDGRKNLAALHDQIRALTLQLDGNAAAHELALRLDRDAVAGWFKDLQENPETIIEGISSSECCDRCSEQHGCVLTGGLGCGHPVKAGRIPPGLQGNPAVRAVYRAAAEKLEAYR